ncbi:MAG: FAD-dependent oxidoreductase, partial [Myxococcota bacterium]
DVEIRAAEVEGFDFDNDRSSDAIRVHTSEGDGIADAVVIASGAWTGRWLPELPFRTSRGQLTLCGEAVPLRCVVSAHGYMTKSVGGHHVLGATYARGDEDPSVRREDHEKNLERLRAWAPTLADRLTVVGGRAAQRSQVPDHLPVVGRVGVLRVLGALGSRGFALAPLAAEVLVAEMCHGVPPLERAGRAAISPERYLVPAPTGPVGTD